MKIFMIGEAANHAGTLSSRLPVAHEIVALPREAAHSDEHDHLIGPQDVVVSMRLKRESGRFPRCRLFQLPGAGADAADLSVLDPSTPVCNAYEHETPIAEFVIASMLNWEIRMQAMIDSFSPQAWPALYSSRVLHGEIAGKTLGILGFGHIGRAIASRAKAFGMTVLGLKATPGGAAGLVDEILPPSRLDEILARADYLVICCPLSDTTRGMIGAAELSRMKESAVLINVARAEIVDEAALFNALWDRRIGGAVLDVWYRYPTSATDRVKPANHPFDTLDNVVCTPHSSAWTAELFQRRYAFVARNIARVVAGEPLENVIRAPVEA